LDTVAVFFANSLRFALIVPMSMLPQKKRTNMGMAVHKKRLPQAAQQIRTKQSFNEAA